MRLGFEFEVVDLFRVDKCVNRARLNDYDWK
jgi:hypothetical protein